VRLTLREISDDESADTKDSAAPETPSAANLAGRLKASTDKEKKAAEHADAARIKMNSRDGAGCIAELDIHDKMDARPGGLSTNSASAYAMTRGQCLMLAGDCKSGKDVYRKALEKSAGANMDASQLDRAVDAWAGMNCQGSNLSGRERIMRASMALNQGLMSKKDPAFCNEHIKTLRDTILTTPPKDEDDRDILNAPDSLNNIGVMCLAKSGDCAGAFRLYQELMKRPDYYKYAPAERRELISKRGTMTPEVARMSFDSINSSCKGK
jgi:tetratricopeptide (TPR) repeat protein